MNEFSELIRRMCDIAGGITKQYYRNFGCVEHKSDESPVTIADRTIEKSLRELIEKERPQDGFWGEEFGIKESANGLMWVVDPIDGTKSFIAGRPSFGTLIALWEDEKPIISCIYQPITQELWLGQNGQATTLNGKEIRTANPQDLSKLRIGSTAPSQFDNNPELLLKLRDTADFIVWGGDCYLYGMLAFGGLDVVIESGLATYDYAAIPAVVNGAGGLATDWNGAPMTLNSAKDGGHFLCCANGAVQEKILELLKEED